MAPDPAEILQAQRAMWAAGEYPEIAVSIEAVSQVVVDEAGIASDMQVLDVATGNGNAALAAARRGAEVTGLDLTPALLENARARADAEGLDIAFVEGDAQALPFPPDSFDRVTSVFGAMFAPDHARTAAELLRVCRPGGTIAVAAWTPDGINGQMFAVLGRHLPPPPEGMQPPPLWGVEEHVRGLFAGAADVRCEVRHATGSIAADSPDAWVDHLERVLGPVVLAKGMLEPQGKWDAARADMVDLYARNNEADDGTLRAAPSYLLTVARA